MDNFWRDLATMRGRKGKSRYISKRQSVISFGEFEALIEKIDIKNVTFRSLVTILYYIGLRIAEIVGDGPRKWKKLTKYGKSLSRDGDLPKNWKDSAEGELWYWEERT